MFIPVARAFDDMLRRIEPDPSERKDADRRANEVRDAVKKHLGSQIFRHFVGGSVGRSTNLKPMKDIDLVFQMDPARAPFSCASHTPTQATDWFEEAARSALRPLRGQVGRQHRSLVVTLPGLPTRLDLVLLCPHPRDSASWQLADLERNAWIFADPGKQTAALKTAMESSGRAPLNRYIRLIKRANSLQLTRLRSYYIEVMCYDAFREVPKSFMAGFEQLCGHLAGKLLRRQENPAGLGPNIDDQATPQVRQDRQRRYLELQRTAGSALSLEKQGRLAEAHREWRMIFGEVYVGEE